MTASRIFTQFLMFIGLIDSLFSSSDEEDISSMYASFFRYHPFFFLVVCHSCLYYFISFIFHSLRSQRLLWSVNSFCESTCISLSCPLLSFPIGLRASLPPGLNRSTSFLFTGNIDIPFRVFSTWRPIAFFGLLPDAFSPGLITLSRVFPASASLLPFQWSPVVFIEREVALWPTPPSLFFQPFYDRRIESHKSIETATEPGGSENHWTVSFIALFDLSMLLIVLSLSRIVSVFHTNCSSIFVVHFIAQVVVSSLFWFH